MREKERVCEQIRDGLERKGKIGKDQVCEREKLKEERERERERKKERERARK